VTRRVLKTSKAKRDRAAALILRGESTIEDQARRLHVQPRAVKAWVTMAKNGTRQGRKGRAELEAAGEEPSFERSESTARLDSALRSAELEGGAANGDEEPESSSAPESDIPPPDPATLVAFTETIRGQALKMYAGVVGVDPLDPRAASVFTLSDEERNTLLLWAPYAAKYVPVLVGRSDEVGAWMYVGATVANLWTAMATLRRLAPKPIREPEQVFPGPGAHPRARAFRPRAPSEPMTMDVEADELPPGFRAPPAAQ